MRILQLTTHLNIGGIGVYVTNLSKSLKDRGHTVFVASSGGDLENSFLKCGISHFNLDIKTKSELSPKIIKSFIALKKIIKSERIELIHAHTRVAAVSAALASFSSGVPYVTTCHGFFRRHLGRLLCGCWGEKVIAISEAVKEHLMEDFGLSENRVALVYTGIDVNRFSEAVSEARKQEIRQRFGLSGRLIIIGNIGRFSPVKGQVVLIRASKKILDDFPEARVLLIGDGPDEKCLKELVTELGVGGKVIFAKSELDTRDALSVMDLFVLPSIKEGLGLSLLEAMACGVPCAASDIGGIKNVIEDGRNGLLFIAGDSDDLSRVVKRMLSDRSLRESAARNGMERILRYFTIDRMAEEVEVVYKNAINFEEAGSRKPEARKKILIFNVNWLGDVIFSTPFIRAVREAYPESYIACVVVPRCREILETNPRIDELIIFDEDGSERGIIGKMRFIARLRKYKFDAAFILHRSFTRALLARFAGIKERVGYDTKLRGMILTKRLKPPEKETHKAEYFLKLAEAIGADISKKSYEFFITRADRQKAEAVLRLAGFGADDRFVVFNPGGNWGPKRWPEENFSLLGDMLAAKYGVKVLISGAAKDEKLADEVSMRMKNKAVSICGKTAIRELAAVFEKAALVISGDSGPMHIAVSAGARTIAVFGPTDPKITGPYGGDNYTVIQKDIGCPVPCYDTACRDNRCMRAVLPEDVMEVIEKKGYL